MSFVVITDSSGNLQRRQIQENALEIIPFSYYVNGEEHNIVKDGGFDAEAFYARIRRGLKVTTSQIPPQRYADFFEPALRLGKDVLFVAMSSGISGSCQSARIAAKMLMEIYPGRIIEVIDTLGASLGEGIIALHAARLQKLGRSVPETDRLMLITPGRCLFRNSIMQTGPRTIRNRTPHLTHIRRR